MPPAMDKNLITESMTLVEALRIIDQTKTQIALVHAEGRLVGTLTDGDIRRAILVGTSLDTPAGTVMNRNPITVQTGTPRAKALLLMRRHSIHQLPVVDADGRLHGLMLINDLLDTTHNDNWVVLMAGGLGTRLKPLTDDTPKPLIKVGDKPILETIVSSFISSGFRKFFLSVNYQADMIEAHFGDGLPLGTGTDGEAATGQRQNHPNKL